MQDELKQNKEKITERYTFEIHYYLEENGECIHKIDANVKLHTDEQLLKMISYVARQLNVDIFVEEQALEEGGIKKYLLLAITFLTSNAAIYKGSALYIGKTAVDLLKEYISTVHIISPAEKTQTALDNSEIVDKKQQYRANGYTEEEIQNIFDGIYELESDDKCKETRSEYYKAMNKEKRLTRVGFSYIDDKGKKTLEQKVPRNEFENFFYTPTNDLDDIRDKTILLEIYMPCNDNTKKKKWSGILNREDISFEMKDKEFAKKVNDKEIIIPHGFYIIAKFSSIRNKDQTFIHTITKVINYSEDSQQLLDKYSNIIEEVSIKNRAKEKLDNYEGNLFGNIGK